MSKSIAAPSSRVRRDNLFIALDCNDCPLLQECGGSTTAPCGCIRDGDPCYDCQGTNTLCRARDDGAYLDSLQEGKSLNDVSLDQRPMSFPLFIPTRTRELGSNVRMNLRWAGVSLKNLLREKKTLPGEVHPLLASDHDIREEVCVDRHCQLLAVLNGQDYQLEGLWAMERRGLYERLTAHEFAAVTGPTFSIASEFHPESRTPASHNVLMLKRHHRVLSEIPALTPATAIPNLYWRDGRERREWSEWLNENSAVHTVTRDFSLMRVKHNFPRELAGLVEIVRRVDRPLHVLLLGVGPGNAKRAITRLAEQECTCSVITPYPIYTAVCSGCEMVARLDGPPAKRQNMKLDRKTLALRNLEVMERYLIEVASVLPLYDTDSGINNVTHVSMRDGKALSSESLPPASPDRERATRGQRSLAAEEVQA